MKKIVALILAALMATFAFVSCGDKNYEPGDPDLPENLQSTGANEEPGSTTVDTWQDTPAFVYDRVVLLGVDGAGAFFNKTETPNIDRMFADGAVTYEMWSVSPSSSAPNWGSMLHGVLPSVHQLDNDIAENYAFNPDSLYPSVFRVIREAYPDATLASFSTWEAINIGIIEENLGVYKDTAGEDSELIEKIIGYLEENDPKMLFVQFDDCDGAGHGTGYGNETHLNQITITDGYIGRIYDLYQSLGRAENTLFIVTTDHGGTLNGSHGGSSEVEMKNMFAIKGKSVVKDGDIKSLTEKGKDWGMEMRDIASVILYAFDLDQPKTWSSMVPNGMFEGCVTSARPEYQFEYKYAHRTHENTPIPAEDVLTVLGEDRFLSYLSFEDKIEDAMGTELSVKGNEKYVAGYYGKAAKMEKLSVRLEDFWPGNDSFSVAMWFNTKGSSGTAALACNKFWGMKSDEGFMLALEPGNILFNCGNGTEEMNVRFPLPQDYVNGWVHVILSVDRKEGMIGLSYDFGDFITYELPESFADATMDGFSGLTIGQDATRNLEKDLEALVDDVLVIDGALSDKDVAALAQYYGVAK